ncbi:hypothetical protein [Xenorhabdus eapokensis]|uniref:Uncharacterized protein n=1 Tax=Xenorhabdus eapokensis TaxID=1873482 RepID=A0A1Q5TN06_9GAMM|nr:hypothetical protein [Xenorhabdus eapokensis]OKP01582.1 hypothetical protein Xedl_02856 [Xenorhabdus eapokensis]
MYDSDKDKLRSYEKMLRDDTLIYDSDENINKDILESIIGRTLSDLPWQFDYPSDLAQKIEDIIKSYDDHEKIVPTTICIFWLLSNKFDYEQEGRSWFLSKEVKQKFVTVARLLLTHIIKAHT